MQSTGDMWQTRVTTQQSSRMQTKHAEFYQDTTKPMSATNSIKFAYKKPNSNISSALNSSLLLKNVSKYESSKVSAENSDDDNF